MPVRAIEFDQLASLIDESIKSPETRAAFVGVDFTKYKEDFDKRGGPGTPDFYAVKGLGFELCCDAEGIIKLIYLYSALAKKGFASFPSKLPGGLTFGSSQAETLAALGPPTKSGTEQLVPTVGKVGPWDRYDLTSFSLHFQFAVHGKRITAITIMAPDRVP